MRTATSALLKVRSVFFLVHLFRSSHGGLEQPSRDDVACSPDTQPDELTDFSGWFSSPNYPSNYPTATTCSWLITSRSTTVSLDFIDIFTEIYDRVRIYNGNTTSDILLGDFGGRVSPPPTGIHSAATQMLVVFNSDNFTAYTGFNASYTSSDYGFEPDACQLLTRPLVLTDSEGSFQSNGFPVAYASLANCQWLFISSLPDGIVRLEFDVFVTEFRYDFARIYDGKDKAALLLGELSGSSPTLQKLFYSSQRYLYLQFTSDSTIVYSGFNGTYRSQVQPTTTAFPPGLCGTNLHVSPGEATIPPTHDIICQLDKVDTEYLQTYCVDLVQNLPGIGNADELINQGGNFGCYLTYEESYDDAPKACYDNYQWFSRLGTCDACTRMYVCIRFQ